MQKIDGNSLHTPIYSRGSFQDIFLSITIVYQYIWNPSQRNISSIDPMTFLYMRCKFYQLSSLREFLNKHVNWQFFSFKTY